MTRKLECAIQLLRSLLPAFVVAGGLVASLARAGSGDLDPAFADHGRQVSIHGAAGVARSVEASDAGGLFVAGGDVDVRFYIDWMFDRLACRLSVASFASLLDGSGTPDSSFAVSGREYVETLAMARSPDGGIVAVGRDVSESTFSGRCRIRSRLTVFRLQGNGTLAADFAENGAFTWPDFGSAAHAVLVETDGRIVVAGFRTVVVDEETIRYDLLVLRLLADGSLDASFGDGGVYVGPETDGGGIRVLRTRAGNYRLSANTANGCAIFGLTEDGNPDLAFGNEGFSVVTSSSGSPVACASIQMVTNDGMLVAGTADERGFVARLDDSGVADVAFAADAAVGSSFEQVTSVVGDSRGRIWVTGPESGRASIMRLDSTGQLDAAFGDGGRSWIDLPSELLASTPVVFDMLVQDDGSVIAAGGDTASGLPFVVRLLGDTGGASPGVVGFTEGEPTPKEADAQAFVRVRRSGGSDGAVSVGYRTVGDWEATSDADFEATSGTLHWADGDSSEKKIAVQIIEDGGAPELDESFRVELHDAGGGAGIATRNARITIQPDGSPGGQVAIAADQFEAGEGGVGQVQLWRNYFFEGQVCVTLTAKSGTATAGEDFVAVSQVVCWGDQDGDGRLVEIPIADDDRQEETETFVVELSNPKGGAVIGQSASATISLFDNDSPVVAPRPPAPLPPVTVDGNGGGGPVGLETLLLLSLLLASASAAARTRQAPRRWACSPRRARPSPAERHDPARNAP